MPAAEYASGSPGGWQPAASWAERWLGFRNGLLTSERFRAWASRFPLTRRIARRRARELFDLCAGFVYSQILLACVRLGVFQILSEGAQPVAVMASRTGLPLESMRRLLDGAVSLRLVERCGDDRFALGALGASLIENPGVVAMIEHHAMVYRDLADPVALLQGTAPETELRRYWSYVQSARPNELMDDRTASYSALMSASQAMVAAEILAAYPFQRHRHLMDVGGGEGVFLRTAAAQFPDLRLTMIDLPAVAVRAAARLAAAGLSCRTAVIGGDFRSGQLPDGADVITLIRVLHDHDDGVALDLLRSIRLSLPPDGVLVLAEPFAETTGAEPIGHAYFGFYLLAMGSGRPRTAADIQKLLRQAGFTRFRRHPTAMPMVAQIISARP